MMRKTGLVVSVLLFAAAGAQAVILAGGDGTQNTTAPAGGQGWDYVGKITGSAPSSVTYIDNNWFITAYHVESLDNPTGVILGGSTYSIDNGSWTRLQNSSGGNADLAMFRVTGEVGLSGLTVRTSSTANGSGLTMIGNGRNRETTETFWNSSWNEVTPPPPALYSGYKWAAGSTKRWGANNKTANAGLVNDGFGVTDMFYTTFNDIGGDEAQGATYDSGGGVFYDTGSEWELAGIMITVGPESGQPFPGTSVYGNKTYIADLSDNADQIAATVAIPEPSALVLGSASALAIFWIRRVFSV